MAESGRQLPVRPSPELDKKESSKSQTFEQQTETSSSSVRRISASESRAQEAESATAAGGETEHGGRHVFFHTISQLVFTVLATALFVLTACFARSTFSPLSVENALFKVSRLPGIDISSTLTILRVLQGLLSICASFVVMQSFDFLAWAMAARPQGIRTLLLLSLSPTTELLGTLGLLASRHARWTDRAGALCRVAFVVSIWVSGVILFAKTTIIVLYESAETYPVTAGIGSFNGSMFSEYMQRFNDSNPGYEYAVLPFSDISTASRLVTNPMHSTAISPIECEEGRICNSYLLSGGLMMATPWAPTNYTKYPLITISNAPTLQVDFVHGIHNDEFVDSQDCTSFGEEGFLVGIKFCLAHSRSKPGSLFAGIFVCDNGAQEGECWTVENPPEITATFSLYSRLATFTTARENVSVISIDKIGAPTQQLDLDVESLKSIYAWLLDFEAANIPPPSSIAWYFWAATKQLSNPYWSAEATQIFHSMLAFPFWLFNANNFGNINLDPYTITSGLPIEFYTTASVDTPVNQIAVNRSMFIAFCVLQAIALAFTWTILLWLWITNPRLPEISSYPVIDMARKTKVVELTATDRERVSDVHARSPAGLSAQEDSGTIRRLLKSEVIVICRQDLVERAGEKGPNLPLVDATSPSNEQRPTETQPPGRLKKTQLPGS